MSSIFDIFVLICLGEDLFEFIWGPMNFIESACPKPFLD